MGRVRTSRRRGEKNKSYKKALRTRCRPMDIDQVQDMLKKEQEEGKPTSFEVDDDLPGY